MIITDTILYKIVTYTKINRILTKIAYYIVNERSRDFGKTELCRREGFTRAEGVSVFTGEG
jgi:hypothetical protein